MTSNVPHPLTYMSEEARRSYRNQLTFSGFHSVAAYLAATAPELPRETGWYEVTANFEPGPFVRWWDADGKVWRNHPRADVSATSDSPYDNIRRLGYQ